MIDNIIQYRVSLLNKNSNKEEIEKKFKEEQERLAIKAKLRMDSFKDVIKAIYDNHVQIDRHCNLAPFIK